MRSWKPRSSFCLPCNQASVDWPFLGPLRFSLVTLKDVAGFQSRFLRGIDSVPGVVVLGLAVPDAEVLDAVGHVLLAL